MHLLRDWKFFVEGGAPHCEADEASLRWFTFGGAVRVQEVDADPGEYILLSQGLASVRVNCGLRTVHISDPAGQLTPAFVAELIADVLAPRILSHLGHLVLHAGAVEIGGAAVALIGPSGQGKSTLVGSFHAAGLKILGDDTLIISASESCVTCEAVNRRLHLLPDSASHLFGTGIGHTPARPRGTKVEIPLTARLQPHSRRTSLTSLVFLARPDESDREISIVRLSPSEACLALVGNSFALWPADTSRAAARMRQASAIAEKVPAFHFSYPRDYQRLGEARESLEELGRRNDLATPLGTLA